jgi:hypothetical protein
MSLIGDLRIIVNKEDMEREGGNSHISFDSEVLRAAQLVRYSEIHMLHIVWCVQGSS